LRQYLSDPNVDIMSPETSRRVLAVAPTIGGPALNAAIAARREGMQAQTAALDNSLKQHTVLRQQIPGIMLLPETDRQGAWGRYLEQLYAVFPQYRGQISPTYSDDVARQAMDAADKIAERIAQQRIELEGSPAIFDPLRRELTFPREGAAPAAPGAAPTATPMSAPAAPGAAAGDTIPLSAPATGAAPVPTSRSTDISTILPAIDRGEGRGANPASSARGQFQFIDPTFIDEFKRNFPDIARGMSNSQILSYRNSTLPDGRPIEEFLGEAHTNRNAATLSRAGFEPNGTNLYLAHFAGAGGARRLLSADPNTPVERILTPDAIDANPFLRGKTAGQIIAWAGDTVDYGPGAARRRLLAMGAPDNRVEPGAALTSPVLQTPLTDISEAPVANAMSATPVTNAFVTPAVNTGADADVVLASDARPTTPGLPRNIAEARDMANQRREADALSQARARQQAKEEGEERERTRGRTQVQSQLNTMWDLYKKLDSLEAIPNIRRSGASRLSAYAAGTTVGQEVEKMRATEAQQFRDQLQSIARFLITDLRKATGMTAGEANSIPEFQSLVRAVSDPTQSIDSVRGILTNLSKRMGAEREFTLPESAVEVPGPRRTRQAPPASSAAPTEGGWSIRPAQ
jgi:hypothetical protein